MSLIKPAFPAAPLVDPSLSRGGVFAASATQECFLGAKLDLKDGRVFRYAQAGGTALVQAFMTQGAVPSAKCTAIAQTGYAKAVGSTEVRVLVTTGGIAATEAWTYENALAGGLMVCAATSPVVLGDVYKIVASKMYDETHIDLLLETPIRNAIGATGTITLVMGKYARTIVMPATTATATAAGVPLCPVPINYFYWSQVRGLCPMVVDTGDTITIGAYAGIPATNAVAGTVGAATSTLFAFPVYGKVVSVAAADTVAVIDLMLE